MKPTLINERQMQTTPQDPLLLSLQDKSQFEYVSQIYNEQYFLFQKTSERMEKYMERREFTFHDHIKLVAHACLATTHLPGALLEIGVWKGFCIALLKKVQPDGRILGVDPCIVQGQREELVYFQKSFFSTCTILTDYSYRTFPKLYSLGTGLRVLHIDGGHQEFDVWTDFLLYQHLVIPGGYIIFDDYNDPVHSPEVRIGVDGLSSKGFFKNWIVLGQISPYNNAFVIRKA
jgi:hypothetical protein